MGLRLPQGGGFSNLGQQFGQSGLNAYSRQTPKQETKIDPPGKTAGGALSAGAGMGLAGYQMGSMVGAGAGAAAGTSAAVAGGTAAGAAGGAAAGATTGAATGSMAGPYGAIIGAGIGMLAYFLS